LKTDSSAQASVYGLKGQMNSTLNRFFQNKTFLMNQRKREKARELNPLNQQEKRTFPQI